MITPTNGRIVWFSPANYTGDPLAAIVCHVHSDRMVNLLVIDSGGQTVAVTSVPLLQDDDRPPAGQRYCQWMPYQKGQAAKTEELQKAQAST